MFKHKSLSLEDFKSIKMIIDEMKELGNLKGIILSYRDGRLIAENIGEDSNYKEFAAMCASVLESAEGLGATIGVNKLNKIVAELDDKTIIIIECEHNLFLSFMIDLNSKLESVLNNFSKYCSKLMNYL